MVLEWIVKMDSELNSAEIAEKYMWKGSIFWNVTGCKTFSKVSLYKKASSSIRFSQTYSEVCIFLCGVIELKQSVENTLKV